jgi:hypothetical protein
MKERMIAMSRIADVVAVMSPTFDGNMVECGRAESSADSCTQTTGFTSN